MKVLSSKNEHIRYVGNYIKSHFAVIPTDTLYALAIAITAKNAKDIYSIKNRDRSQPVPIGVSSISMMEKYAVVTELARKIITTVEPGAVTLVLKNRKVPHTLVGDTVGVRIPALTVTRKIINIAGPITLTSANIHNTDPPKDINTAIKHMHTYVKVFLDYGKLPGIPSTVLSVVDDTVKLIREGKCPWNVITGIIK